MYVFMYVCKYLYVYLSTYHPSHSYLSIYKSVLFLSTSDPSQIMAFYGKLIQSCMKICDKHA